jgi:ribosome recycling factor
MDRLEKESIITEDDSKRAKDEIQNLTKKYEDQITAILDTKTEEIQQR